MKDAPLEQLADAVRRVHSGLRVVDPALTEASLFEGASPLSERERQVLRLAAAIGKVGASNRAQAVRIAQDKGWI